MLEMQAYTFQSSVFVWLPGSTEAKNTNQRFLTLSQTQILESSKLIEFADDNLKFVENERKISERIENTVGKGEIARYEQFLLFPQCFQKTCTADK